MPNEQRLADLADQVNGFPRLDRRDESGAKYIRFRHGEWSETIELLPGTLFVDVDKEGRILGFEVLS